MVVNLEHGVTSVTWQIARSRLMSSCDKKPQGITLASSKATFVRCDTIVCRRYLQQRRHTRPSFPW